MINVREVDIFSFAFSLSEWEMLKSSPFHSWNYHEEILLTAELLSDKQSMNIVRHSEPAAASF